jgi:hypothetical protein
MQKAKWFLTGLLGLFAIPMLLAACGGGGGSGARGDSDAPTPQAARSYQATAAAGDFIRITLDPDAGSYTYDNVTTAYSEAGSYAEGADGYLTFSPEGGGASNLVTGFEAPGVGLVMIADETGNTADKTSLVIGVPEASITVADLTTRFTETTHFNYLQFRTTDGGFEFGDITIEAGGLATANSYWPYGNRIEGGGEEGSIDFRDPDQLAVGEGGTFLELTLLETPDGTDPVTSLNYIFKTPTDGILVIDTPQGSMLIVEAQAGKDFQPSWAGTYNAVYYEGNGDETSVDSAGSVSRAAIHVSAEGSLRVTVTDPATGQTTTVLEDQPLTPVADARGGFLRLDPEFASYTWDNHGAFYWQDAESKQELFLVFLEDAVLFASVAVTGENAESIEYGLPRVTAYEYLYGAGLKAAPAP